MLTLQYVPYHEIEKLNSEQRINKLLNIVRDDKLVLMQGRLKLAEETKLIETTMQQINGNFKGIEVCTVYPKKKNITVGDKLKEEFAKLLFGNREGITIIGPATILKEIKRDPTKIQLLIEDLDSKKSRRKKR